MNKYVIAIHSWEELFQVVVEAESECDAMIKALKADGWITESDLEELQPTHVTDIQNWLSYTQEVITNIVKV